MDTREAAADKMSQFVQKDIKDATRRLPTFYKNVLQAEANGSLAEGDKVVLLSGVIGQVKLMSHILAAVDEDKYKNALTSIEKKIQTAKSKPNLSKEDSADLSQHLKSIESMRLVPADKDAIKVAKKIADCSTKNKQELQKQVNNFYRVVESVIERDKNVIKAVVRDKIVDRFQNLDDKSRKDLKIKLEKIHNLWNPTLHHSGNLGDHLHSGNPISSKEPFRTIVSDLVLRFKQDNQLEKLIELTKTIVLQDPNSELIKLLSKDNPEVLKKVMQSMSNKEVIDLNTKYPEEPTFKDEVSNRSGFLQNVLYSIKGKDFSYVTKAQKFRSEIEEARNVDMIKTEQVSDRKSKSQESFKERQSTMTNVEKDSIDQEKKMTQKTSNQKRIETSKNRDYVKNKRAQSNNENTRTR
jgi:hypothetical protein